MSLEDKERRKAEVRERMAAEAEAKKKKKGGFMTPARKKKLRTLLRAKAAEELKKQTALKAAERKRIIEERAGTQKSVEGLNEAELMQVCKEYGKKVETLESEKYDLEYSTAKRDFEVAELKEKVLVKPGKFPKPPLKKVSKTNQQMEKIMMFTAKISASNYRQGLKVLSVQEKPDI